MVVRVTPKTTFNQFDYQHKQNDPLFYNPYRYTHLRIAKESHHHYYHVLSPKTFNLDSCRDLVNEEIQTKTKAVPLLLFWSRLKALIIGSLAVHRRDCVTIIHPQWHWGKRDFFSSYPSEIECMMVLKSVNHIGILVTS